MSTGASESRILSIARLEATQRIGTPTRLFRNNVGAMKDVRGVPVRYGLANDNKLLNAELKSGDLIGGQSLLITPEMVGQTILQFVSVEGKHEGWTPHPNDPHEIAQRRWANLINTMGGKAVFFSEPGTLDSLLMYR